MTCVHLKQLYKLCEAHNLKLSSSDLIRVACTQCGEQEVCPNTMTDEYDAREIAHGRVEGEQRVAEDGPEPQE